MLKIFDIFDIFKVGGMSGISAITALILYQFNKRIRTADDDTRYQPNKGTLGKANHLDWYTGRAKSFATDMDIDVASANINLGDNSTLSWERHNGIAGMCHPDYNWWCGASGKIEWYDSTVTFQQTDVLSTSYNKIHIVFSLTKFDIYYDGVFSESVSTDGYLATNHSNIMSRNGANFLDGQMSNVQAYNKALTASDIALDYAEPEALVNMVANDVSDTRFSVVKADCQLLMPLTEDGATVYDLVGATGYTINNYVDAPTNDIGGISTGLQTSKFLLNGVGMITDKADNVAFHEKERGEPGWNPSTVAGDDFIIEEVIDGTHYAHLYDGTNLQTWTDGVAGSAAAHTPENADYILGKGVYPKVAADAYADYECEVFTIYGGDEATTTKAAGLYAEWSA